MRCAKPVVTTVRLAAGFAAALLVFELTLGAYTEGLAGFLRRTASIWEPPGLVIDSIMTSDGVLTLNYSKKASPKERLPGSIVMPDAFYRVEMGTVVWDFIVLVTLFAGFATGPPFRIAGRFFVALVLLAVLHVLTLGLWIRFGWRPELDLYDGEILSNPWIRQIVPVALWLGLCPMRLFRRTSGPDQPA